MAGRGFGVVRHHTYSGLTLGSATFDGISVTTGSEINHAGQDQLFRFPDTGWLCVEGSGVSVWSTDDGATWSTTYPGTGGGTKQGPYYGAQKSTTILDGETVYSWARTPAQSSVGGGGDHTVLKLGAIKGPIDWSSTEVVYADPISVPDLLPTVNNDGGGAEPVALFKHHGEDIHLTDGGILSPWIAYYNEDADQPAVGYPVEFGMIHGRVIVMRSDDRLATWHSPVTVMDRLMEARGDADAPSDPSTLPAYALLSEGPTEPNLCRAANGDIICVMRSGGRRAGASNALAGQIGTPLYLSYSSDEGATWSLPTQINTLPPNMFLGGQNPNLVCLGNGVLVLVASTGTPEGNLIAYCDGTRPYIFQGVTQLGSTSNYMGIVQVSYDTALIAYTGASGRRVRTVTARQEGESNVAAMQFFSRPMKVQSGHSAMLQWFDRKLDNMTISGGIFGTFGGAGTAVDSNRGASTGALTVATTYRLKGEDVDNPGTYITQDVTVGVI